MKKIIIAVLLVILLASQLVAEPAKFIDNNAALRYLMAIGYMPQMSEKTADKLSYINDLASLKELTSENVRELIPTDGFMSTIDNLLDLAANCTESTFIVDRNYDYESIIPPFRTCRLFARFINAHGWMDAEKKDYVSAAKRFIHVYRIGLGVGKDGFAINAMVGVRIQRMAVESINNLLKLSNDSKMKQVLTDYFSNLPRPIFDSATYIRNEQLLIENSLTKAEKKPEVLVILGVFNDDIEKSVPVESPLDKACMSNQRVLAGATEMYMKDYENVKAGEDSAAFIKKLVDKRYLKSAPVCGNKGLYSIKIVDDGDCVVSCSCGVSLNNLSASPSEEKKAEFSPEIMTKVGDYLKSDVYKNGKKEIAAIYDEMLKIDPYTAAGDEKAGKLSERIKNHKSLLVKTLGLNLQVFYKTLRENNQLIDDLVTRLKK